ncbi:MAG TPA: S41 family peptidase [Chthoniobacterales bacterium]|nr:S41 family peptidase [Chthoniobacterales bacterium]
MSHRHFLFSLVLLACLAVPDLSAQSPGKPPASPSPTPTPAPTATASPSPTTRALIDTMDAADLKEAIQLLKNNYIKPENLSETELSRAAFEGILTRLGRGVLLLPNAASDPADASAPFYGELLDGHVGYLRLGALNRQNLDALDSNLQNFSSKKADAIVLDFRASPATNDFAVAADFAKRFCPKDKLLFTLRKTTAKQEKTFTCDRDPAYQGLLIILADADTAGAAEAVAGVIRVYQKALLIGQPTAGRAVEYSDLKLPSGKVLRVAVGEAILPEGRPLFPGGLKPDVPVELAAADKREIFQASREKGMTPFVVESSRPHLNEAALISGKNPEIEAMETAQRRNRNPEKATVHDVVLQRALDAVTSITIFQKK